MGSTNRSRAHEEKRPPEIEIKIKRRGKNTSLYMGMPCCLGPEICSSNLVTAYKRLQFKRRKELKPIRKTAEHAMPK